MSAKPGKFCRIHRWTFIRVASQAIGRIWICAVCGQEQHEHGVDRAH